MIATLARFHAPTVRTALDVLHPDGGVIEVRILNTPHGTVSGYFDDKDRLVKAVAPYDGTANIYVTLNPVSPDLLARAHNRLKDYVRVTTKDAEILSRQWFPMDLDAERPAGISSTDAEKAAAIARRDVIISYLCIEGGYPEMLLADSGNGAHALVRCSFPNTPDIAALFQRALQALARRFTDAQVKLDPDVFNASRIWKLYGTIAAKGDPIPTRPHRRAEITSAPETPGLLTREQLEWLADQAPAPVARTYSVPSDRRDGVRNLVAEFERRGLYLRPLAPPKHAVTCPWQGEHSTDSGISETVLFEPADPGAPWGFKCQHAHCSGRTIKDVLALFRNGAEFQRDTGAMTLRDADRGPHGSVNTLENDWPTLAEEALYGLAGDLVRTIDPYSEADRVATLAHFLAAFGNLIGPGPHCRVQHDEHPGRLNFGLVGATSKGRKGLSWSVPRELLSRIDEAWAKTRIRSGLSSGEGLIYHVRDAHEELQPVKEKGRVIRYESVTVDAGEEDKRLLIIEPELAVILRRMASEGNTLSAVIRGAWDSGRLSTLTKHAPLRATGAHVSIVGHITREELLRYLTETERGNGFANRFIWLLVRRSKSLPEGEAPPEAVLAPLIDRVQQAARFAQQARELRRDDETRKIWAAVYQDLVKEKPGLFGAIVSRAEAQVLRLSVVYALLDLSSVIRRPHLLAATALWEHSERSARLIFGDATGNQVADRILKGLRMAGELTETAIRDLFHRNTPGRAIDLALDLLARGGLAQAETKPTHGRPVTVWRPTT